MPKPKKKKEKKTLALLKYLPYTHNYMPHPQRLNPTPNFYY
jgi:hypothetical protein